MCLGWVGLMVQTVFAAPAGLRPVAGRGEVLRKNHAISALPFVQFSFGVTVAALSAIVVPVRLDEEPVHDRYFFLHVSNFFPMGEHHYVEEGPGAGLGVREGAVGLGVHDVEVLGDFDEFVVLQFRQMPDGEFLGAEEFAQA